MNRLFDDANVIVTGASRGIGREVALRFAAQGARVACVATSVANAEPTAVAIREAGGQAWAFGCDVSDSAAVDATIAQIFTEVGDPAVLVNNAGLTRDALLLRLKEEDWDRVLAVNLKGAYLFSQAVAKPMMKARYGRIVNVSSIIGVVGGAGQANYAASKAGLIGLTMSIAKELGGRGITCNAVAPGFIETDMTETLPPEFKEHVIKTAPIGRLGVAADVAHAILFLASPDSGYVTGQVLVVDGGLTLG
jgi:3-oxoacyl-[acyl-carrier protein] reductase